MPSKIPQCKQVASLFLTRLTPPKRRLTFNGQHGVVFQKIERIIQGVPGGKVNIHGGHSIGHSKGQKCIFTCVLLLTVSVPKLLITKRYYVVFLIPVFIVQVTKLVQFT
jgi:hypothetical protein